MLGTIFLAISNLFLNHQKLVLNKKVIIITGASSGIGEHLSKSLAKKGAIIICAARRKNELERVSNEIKKDGGSAYPIKTDIRILDDCRKLMQKTVEKYGKIDALILNAGLSMWSKFDEIEDISYFKTLMDTNYMGAVNCCHYAVPYLKKTAGKIISCSTAQALMGFPNHSGYAASKHALHGFLSTLSIELKYQISFLEVILGWIKGTNLRYNALGQNDKNTKTQVRKHTEEAVDLNECVREIILAIESEKTKVYIPKKLSLIPFLKVFFNTFLEKKTIKAIKRNKK